MIHWKIAFIFGFGSIIMSAFLVQGQGSSYQCNPVNPDVTNTCIGCICEASTRCNTTVGCINSGGLCGPFLISQAFWVDAGRCRLSGDNSNERTAFQNCVNDIGCASDTLRSYINRFSKDCNGDQLVTCDDYMMLHKNGGWNCGTDLSRSKYGQIFNECKNVVISNNFEL